MSRKNKDTYHVMPAMGMLALLIGVILLLAGVSLSQSQPTLAYTPMNSIVKLSDKDGATVCSGVRIAPALIITNAHCVDGVDERTVTTKSGAKSVGKVLWRGTAASGNDLALLETAPAAIDRVARIDCKAGALVNGTLKSGDEVIAIGMPAGLAWAQTRGYVSAIGRQGSELDASLEHKDLIELNVTAIGGNSGGGLFTLDGRFVGMPTLAMHDGGTFAWAIPAATICKFLGRS